MRYIWLIGFALYLLLIAALLSGCAALPVEDRSAWSQEMKNDYAECEAWALMAPMNFHRADGTPRSTGDWLKSCLRGRGWR